MRTVCLLSVRACGDRLKLALLVRAIGTIGAGSGTGAGAVEAAGGGRARRRQHAERMRMDRLGGVGAVRAQARPSQHGMMPADKPQRIDAFFAKRVDDHMIDVHSEGQKMMRIVMNPGCGWECAVHPQPTLDDLDTSIALARERNLRVLHLAGHAKKTCGFIWNREIGRAHV